MNPDTESLIREAVRSEERDLARSITDDQPITEMIIQNFRGRRMWVSLFPIGLSLIYSALLVWSGYQFFQSETTKLQITWATGFVVFAMSVGLTKVWVWGEWNRYSLIREIKRLELAVAELSNRVGPRE